MVSQSEICSWQVFSKIKKKKGGGWVGVDFVLFSTTLQHSAAIFGQLGGFQKTLVSSLSIVSRHCPLHPPSVHVFIKAFWMIYSPDRSTQMWLKWFPVAVKYMWLGRGIVCWFLAFCRWEVSIPCVLPCVLKWSPHTKNLKIQLMKIRWKKCDFFVGGKTT